MLRVLKCRSLLVKATVASPHLSAWRKKLEVVRRKIHIQADKGSQKDLKSVAMRRFVN